MLRILHCLQNFYRALTVRCFAERPRIPLGGDEVIVLGVADVLEGQIALVLARAPRKSSRVWRDASLTLPCSPSRTTQLFHPCVHNLPMCSAVALWFTRKRCSDAISGGPLVYMEKMFRCYFRRRPFGLHGKDLQILLPAALWFT